MSVVREAAGQLLKMFVADAVVTKGVVLVVSLVGVLTRYTIINRLVAGGRLLFGTIAVLLLAVLIAARPRRTVESRSL